MRLTSSLRVLAATISLVQAAGAAAPGKGKINWTGLCDQSMIMICGTLEVPLDYTDPSSNETLTLELAKFPAIKKPQKESVLVNFGGPGIPGLDIFSSSGLPMFAYVLDCHVYWDRGF